MRLYPYLCGMKIIKLITLTAFLFCLNKPLFAQFNTIGSINNKRIYTINPPKPKDALTDSIVVADSVPVHKRIMHNGIDLSARYEKVYSMFPGTVIKVGQDSRSGKFVTVRTGNYTISYCHLSQQLVKEKEFVSAGTIIAISGNTGASTGPHLHLTTKKDGQAFNAAILLEYIKNLVYN